MTSRITVRVTCMGRGTAINVYPYNLYLKAEGEWLTFFGPTPLYLFFVPPGGSTYLRPAYTHRHRLGGYITAHIHITHAGYVYRCVLEPDHS